MATSNETNVRADLNNKDDSRRVKKKNKQGKV